MKRLALLVLAALAVFTLALSLVPRATAQDVAQELTQDAGPKQDLNIIYPGKGIILSGTGDDAVRYKGLIYVKVFPVSTRLRKKYGDGPMFSGEMYPDNSSGGYGAGANPHLPIGEYEVHFSMREGDTMRTCIKRNILLTTNGVNVEVEMSGTSQTLIIGGDDMTAQQMRTAISAMARAIIALQAEVAALKGNTKAATPAPGPTDPPAK